MVFAPETEQSGKESPTELFFHDSKEKLPFSRVTMHPWDPLPPRVPLTAPCTFGKEDTGAMA